MSSESLDQRLSEGSRVEYRSPESESYKQGRITGIDGTELQITVGDDAEWIGQDQISSLLERSTDGKQTHQMSREDVPEKPGYEREIDENVDASLADALKTASIAGEDYLEALFAAELGSFRLERGVYDDE